MLEREHLAALIRQLEQLDLQVTQPRLTQSEFDRYHFEYERLQADLAQVRTGVAEYLTPSRAQPRNPLLLQGHYGLESTALPEPSP